MKTIDIKRLHAATVWILAVLVGLAVILLIVQTWWMPFSGDAFVKILLTLAGLAALALAAMLLAEWYEERDMRDKDYLN